MIYLLQASLKFKQKPSSYHQTHQKTCLSGDLEVLFIQSLSKYYLNEVSYQWFVLFH